MSAILTKDTFLEGLSQFARLGKLASEDEKNEEVFQDADKNVASLLVWWYGKNPQALPPVIEDVSEFPWHVCKAIGHLLFSQTEEMIVRRNAYKVAYSRRTWNAWELIGSDDLWAHAFKTAESMVCRIGRIRETEEEVERGQDTLQAFINLLFRAVLPDFCKKDPAAFPIREFNEKIWMNGTSRMFTRAGLALCPPNLNIMTSEREIPQEHITILFVCCKDDSIGDILAVFYGDAMNPVGDCTGMKWRKDMFEKEILVLALAGFYLDSFNSVRYGYDVRRNIQRK